MFFVPSGSALRNLLVFLRRITGAYVSGRVGIMIRVQTPAKINMTQNTHRQDVPLWRMLKQNEIGICLTHRKRKTYYPLIIGPRTGPRKTLAVNRLVAGPRPTADQISAMTPTNIIKQPMRFPKLRWSYRQSWSKVPQRRIQTENE